MPFPQQHTRRERLPGKGQELEAAWQLAGFISWGLQQLVGSEGNVTMVLVGPLMGPD